jgi:nucleotide-binding universal stress UspA family protein
MPIRALRPLGAVHGPLGAATRRVDAGARVAGSCLSPVFADAVAIAREEPSIKKILLAYDGGEPARRALEQTIELATRLEAEVGVVSVVPARSGRAPIDPWDDRAVHAEELLEARRALRAAGIEAEMLEPGGDVARTIERLADERGYDTIVVGTRGARGLARTFQGSVSEHVASHAHVTVVVAR